MLIGSFEKFHVFLDFFLEMTMHYTNFDIGNLNYCCTWSYKRDFEDQILFACIHDKTIQLLLLR